MHGLGDLAVGVQVGSGLGVLVGFELGDRDEALSKSHGGTARIAFKESACYIGQTLQTLARRVRAVPD